MRFVFMMMLLVGVATPAANATELYKDEDFTLRAKLDVLMLASSQSNAFYIDKPDSDKRKGQHNRDFDFFQYSVHPQFYIEGGNFYGGLSAVYAATEGDGEPFEFNHHNKTKQAADLENAYIGWRNDKADISAGAQRFKVADGLIVADGRGSEYGAAWLGPKKAFENTAIARGNFGSFTPTAFYLRAHDNSAAAELVGGELAFSGEDNTTASIYGFRIFDASHDSLRKGLNVVAVHLNGDPAPKWNLEFSAVRQSSHKVSATGWYGSVGYDFDVATAFLRRSQFSGDKKNTKHKSEAFDPLFIGTRDFGSWWAGEILAQQHMVNSNLRIWTLGIRKDIDWLEGTTLGTNLYQFDYDVAVEGERSLGQEIDVFATIYATEQINITPLIGFLKPDDAAKKQYGHQAKTATLVAIIADFSF